MTLKTTSKVRPNYDAAQLYLSVKFVQDSTFPFNIGQEVAIYNIGDYLLVTPADGDVPDSIDTTEVPENVA